jgi:hypothetical protein
MRKREREKRKKERKREKEKKRKGRERERYNFFGRIFKIRPPKEKFRTNSSTFYLQKGKHKFISILIFR